MLSSRFSTTRPDSGRLFSLSLLAFCLVIAANWSVPGSSRATECLLNHLGGEVQTLGESQRTYSFSGFCVTQYGASSVNNFHYDGTGTWQVAAKTATEQVSTPYGSLTRHYQCDYDPWLEPQAQCSETGSQWAPVPSGYTASQDFPAAWALMNKQRKFPVSAAIFDQSGRQNLVTRVMARSIRIIDPVENQYFETPSLIATVVMERPVIFPPDHLVVLRAKELACPEPGKPDRSFEEAKTYLQTADKLITYFNLGDRDLWGARWQVSAHFLATDPYWSPAVSFEVGPESDAAEESGLAQELSRPVIHNPRPNHAYPIEDDVALEISYPKQAELHLKMGYRAAGQADFTMLEEQLVSPDSADSPGFHQSDGITNLALLAGGTAVDIKIEAWCTHTEELANGWTVPKESELSSVISRVLVSPPTITSPSEGRLFVAPATVPFVIEVPYQKIDYDLENYLEVQMLHAPFQGDNPIPPMFIVDDDGEFSTSRQGQTLQVRYYCGDAGRYRFRARISIPAGGNHPALRTPWTDWRMIELRDIAVSPSPGQLLPKPLAAELKAEKQSDPVKPQATPSPDTGAENSMRQKLRPSDPVARPQLKAVTPELVLPRETQVFRKTGPVRIRMEGVTRDQMLDWQVQYRGFDQNSFSPIPGRIRLIPSGRGARGTFLATREGFYRFRFRSESPGDTWSEWRSFTVGQKSPSRPEPRQPVRKAPIVKPAPIPESDTVERPDLQKSVPKPLRKSPRPLPSKPRIQQREPVLPVPRPQ